MGRPNTPLTIHMIEPALLYLQRALDRKAEIFSKPPRTAQDSLADLAKRLPRTTATDVHAAKFNEWIARYVTDAGRVKMLAALRRSKADARAGDGGSKTIRVSAATYSGLKRLAAKVGMPMAAALGAAVEVAIVDKTMHERMVKLRVAIGKTPRRKRRPISLPPQTGSA